MRIIALIYLLLTVFRGLCQNPQADHIFLITMDGFRWQELFTGADSLLIDDSGYTDNPEELTGKYWAVRPEKRRALLMPFVWNEIVKNGQVYGNRKYGTKVNCSNTMWFSYPGYSEILCGFADDEHIDSNKKIPNINTSVLEFLNKQPKLKGKVVAFASWDVFPYIINEQRSGVPVNAGIEKVNGDDLSKKEILLNALQKEIKSPWKGVRPDALTYHIAMEYVRRNKPSVVYLAFDETDDFAHDGSYDKYLDAAGKTDEYLRKIWQFIQSTPYYKDRTAMLITTDHGRGSHPKDKWRSHGADVNGADEIWLMALGPGIAPLGEVKENIQLYQNQLAKTVAALLGYKFKSNRQAGEVIRQIVVEK